MDNNTKLAPKDQIATLLAEWNQDSKVDKLEPADELRKIPTLHSKYITIMSTHRQALKQDEREFAKLKRLKHEYYTGRMDEATLNKWNWQAFPYILKGDLNLYIESDKHIQTAKAEMDVHEEIIDLCERILKELNSRTFQLKEVCAWEKYVSGGH